MIRKAFKMKIYADKKEGYIKRHNPVCEELKVILKVHDVSNYSLFLDEETHILFGYVELQNEQKWNEIANTEVCEKWWKYMADIMELNLDNSPKSSNLKEVFHID